MVITGSNRFAAGLAYWAILLAVFVALRLYVSPAELNMDEEIPVKVSEGMSARGDLDPNWRLADVNGYFKIDQYNFYLYNVVSHGVLKVAGWVGAAALPALRVANLGFQLLALGFAIDALRRLGLGAFGIALAGALIAVAPGMVQDAAMARPESLLYLVAALQIWILTVPLSDRSRGFCFGLILATGIAIKATYGLALVLFVVPWLMTWRDRPKRALLEGAAATAIGTVLGLVVAAPYAFIHPDVLLAGFASLTRQYDFGQPPHSLPKYDFLHQALWIAAYFIGLYGLVPLAALAAPFLVTGNLRRLASGFVVLCLLLFVYFAGKAVFYERNFSFVLISLLLAATLAVVPLRQRVWRGVAAIVLVLPMAYWSVQIALATHDHDGRERFEAANGLANSTRIEFDDAHDEKIPERCETVGVVDFNEPWTVHYLALLKQEGFRPIAEYQSRFRLLVTSTLQTYLDAQVHYLRCPESKR